MTTAIILMMSAVGLIGLLFVVWARFGDARNEVDRAIRKKKAMIEKFQEEIEDLRMMHESHGPESEELQKRIDDELAVLAKYQAKLHAISTMEKERVTLFDQNTMGENVLWLVRIKNPDFMKIATGRSENDPLVMQWQKGRKYLIGGSDPEAATKRALARYQPHLGYQVADIEQFRPSGAVAVKL